MTKITLRLLSLGDFYLNKVVSCFFNSSGYFNFLRLYKYLKRPNEKTGLCRYTNSTQRRTRTPHYKTIHLEPNSQPESLIVRSEYRSLKIELADIDFIEGLEDYIRIHLNNKKPVLTLMTMKSVLEKLPADKFKRIHRSYIVAIDKIKSIFKRKVLLASGRELPVSNNYRYFIDEWMRR